MQLMQVDVYPDRVELAGGQVVTKPDYIGVGEWMAMWEGFKTTRVIRDEALYVVAARRGRSHRD